MSSYLLFLLLGIGTGAVYAALGTGLIMVYRGSAVLNFAQGAMAMLPALTFVTLERTGDLVLPWVVLPNTVHIADDPPFWLAFALSMAVAAVVGLVAFLVVFRPIRDAPPITKVVASVGVTIVLQGIAILNFGTELRKGEPMFPTGTLRVLGGRVPVDRLYLAAAVALATVGVWALYRFTRFGLATRASSESEKGALLLGYSPTFIGGLNWVLSAVLAGAAGILITPISGVTPFNYSLFVVPALAAALAGRLRSFGVTALVAYGLGMFQALMVKIGTDDWLPTFFRAGLDSALPFLAIVVVLIATGRTIPGRGALVELRQPRAPVARLGWRTTGLPIAIAVVVLVAGSSGWRFALIQTMVNAVLVLSLVVLAGYVGQVSLAQTAFAGFAAFVLARAAGDWGLPFPLSPLLAIALTTALGLLVGIPAVRIRGMELAAVTLAFAVAIEAFLFRNAAFTGASGTAQVPNPSLFGLDLGILGTAGFPQKAFGLLVLAALVGACLAVVNLRRAGTGRRLLAVRANERAAAAAGVAVPRTKLLANGIASALAGLAGVLIAYQSVVFSAAGFEASTGLPMLALAYVGGIATVGGALVAGALAPAGVVLYAVSELTSGEPSEYQFLLYGIGLLVAAIKVPDGLAGVATVRRRRREERAIQERRLQAMEEGLPAVELLDGGIDLDPEVAER